MNNNLTPETEFEKLLLSDKRIISIVEKLKDIGGRDFIDKGHLDLSSIVASNIGRELFTAEKIGPLLLKLNKIDRFLQVDNLKLFEIDRNGDYEAYESELLMFLNENIDGNGELKSNVFDVNKQIVKLAEKYMLDYELKTKLAFSGNRKIIKV